MSLDHPRAEARELDANEERELRERVFGTHQEILAALRSGRGAAWELSRALYEFHDERGWELLGYDTLKDYLADPEVGLKLTTFKYAVARWRELVVIRRIEAGQLALLDPTKVDVVVPALKRGDVSTEEALNDVEALGQRDLRIKYRQERERDDAGSTGSEESMSFDAAAHEEDDLPDIDGTATDLVPIPKPLLERLEHAVNLGGRRGLLNVGQAIVDEFRRPER